MRIITLPSPPMKLMRAPGAPGAEPEKPPQAKRVIKLGWEDLVMGFALVVILVSWIAGTYGPDQVLAYLGFTTAGGAWGLLSGKGGK